MNYCAIDFGTSNSAVAVPDGAALRLAPVEGAYTTLPTSVFFNTDEDTREFGRAALAAYIDGFDGRLMRSILPITVGAFGLAVAAGSLLFISHASEYLENRFFFAKITLIALAGVNMAVFHLIGARNLDQWENDALPPLFARVAGGLSLFLWVSVVACGRWIGFTMPPV